MDKEQVIKDENSTSLTQCVFRVTDPRPAIALSTKQMAMTMKSAAPSAIPPMLASNASCQSARLRWSRGATVGNMTRSWGSLLKYLNSAGTSRTTTIPPLMRTPHPVCQTWREHQRHQFPRLIKTPFSRQGLKMRVGLCTQLQFPSGRHQITLAVDTQ